MLWHRKGLNEQIAVDFEWSFHGLSSLMQGWTAAKQLDPERMVRLCH
jgi:hypothetical protein